MRSNLKINGNYTPNIYNKHNKSFNQIYNK